MTDFPAHFSSVSWPMTITGTHAFVPTVVGSGAKRGGAKHDRPTTARNAEMEAMYRAGIALKEICQKYGVTRERVRQVMRKRGVPPDEGGRKRKWAVARKAGARLIDIKRASVEKKKAHRLEKLGVDELTYEESKKNGALSKFYTDRKNQQMFGQDWRLSFGEWLSIWGGHLDGRGSRELWLKRIDTNGPFALGNVRVMRASDAARLQRRTRFKRQVGSDLETAQ